MFIILVLIVNTMAKKRKGTKKEQLRPQKTTQPETAAPTNQKSKLTKVSAVLIFVISLLVYSNTFNHGFVLDDNGIIENNTITSSPVSFENTALIFKTPLRKGDLTDKENSLYRPVTKFIFNLEWNAFNGEPAPMHRFHVFLFGLLCVFLFLVLKDLFKDIWAIPFFAALLFATHPIHTEVVANLKSLDEIVSLLGLLGAFLSIQLYLRSSNKFHLFWGVIVYGIGIFSKESAIVALGLIPLFLFYCLPKQQWKKIVAISIPFFVMGIVYIVARENVLSNFVQQQGLSANDNFLVMAGDDLSSSIATSIMLAGYYLFKFFIPINQSCDYSYSTFELVGFDNLGVLISLVVFLAGIVYVVRTLRFKDKIAFGIAWFFISFALVSNVFFLIGTAFGERLLFLPSIGLVVILVSLVAKILPLPKAEIKTLKDIKPNWRWVPFIVLFVLFSGLTIQRNFDWKSDEHLFLSDIKKHPNASHLLSYLGNHFVNENKVNKLTTSLRSLGYTEPQINDSIIRNMNLSVKYFQRLGQIQPDFTSRNCNELGVAFARIGQKDSSMKYWLLAYEKDPQNPAYMGNIGVAYFNKNEFNKALPYFQEAYAGDKTNVDHINNIGLVYASTQRADSAIYWFKRAHQTNSTNRKALELLIKIYEAIGDRENAAIYFNKLQALPAQR